MDLKVRSLVGGGRRRAHSRAHPSPQRRDASRSQVQRQRLGYLVLLATARPPETASLETRHSQLQLQQAAGVRGESSGPTARLLSVNDICLTMFPEQQFRLQNQVVPQYIWALHSYPFVTKQV